MYSVLIKNVIYQSVEIPVGFLFYIGTYIMSSSKYHLHVYDQEFVFTYSSQSMVPSMKIEDHTYRSHVLLKCLSLVWTHHS